MSTQTATQQLGFIKEESSVIVEKLNILLANYHVHYQKLRNFHWNVKGPDFFDIHEQFEEEYNVVKLEIDEIAERIRIFNATPLSTFTDYIETSTIEEASTELSAEEMVKSILSDYSILAGFLIEASESATLNGDIGTNDMVTGYLKRIEKRHWMFTAFSS